MEPFEITELSGERFSAALKDFPLGQRIRYQGVTMWLGPEGHLECEVESSWAPENVTPETAHDDLARASRVVEVFTAASEVFASAAGNLPRREYLGYQYGKGSVEIARRENGTLYWAPWMPSPNATDPRVMESSAWNHTADKISPDGRYRAVIRDAQEFRMGSPTSGTLEIRETGPGARLLLEIDSCSPAFMWSNRSDALAVPQYTYELDQRLIIASPVTGRVRVVPDSFQVLIPYSFNDGVLRGMDSPLYASRPVEIVVDDVAVDAGDRPRGVKNFVDRFSNDDHSTLERGASHDASQGERTTMTAARAEVLSKVPEITLIFWIIKIAATTLGETGGDAVSMSMGLGYLAGTGIFAALFAIAVFAQISARRFLPFLYWTTIVATTTVGTTLADFATRSLGIGYPGGSVILFTLLMASLFIWYRSLGSVSNDTVNSPKAEMFYWVTIMFSQTLGTALGDWIADTRGLGYQGAALIFSALLAIIAGLYYWTSISRTILFWAAFILTRPLGAVVGDFLDKPLDAGGLGLSRYVISAILLVFMALCIAIFPQRPASKSH